MDSQQRPSLKPADLSTASLNKIFAAFRPGPLSSSRVVDEQLRKVTALILRDYVASWYKYISADNEFVAEIVAAVAHVVRQLEIRLAAIDWVVLLSQDVPSVLMEHLVEHRRCSAKLGTAFAGGKSLDELFHGCQPHVALASPEAEKEYLRRVTDILLDILLPTGEVASSTVKLLLREILTNNVLAMIVEFLADPDYLNELLLKILEPDFSAFVEVTEAAPEIVVSDNISDQTAGFRDELILPMKNRKAAQSTLFQVPKDALTSAKFLRSGRKRDKPAGSIVSGISKGFEKMRDRMANSRRLNTFRKKQVGSHDELEFYDTPREPSLRNARLKSTDNLDYGSSFDDDSVSETSTCSHDQQGDLSDSEIGKNDTAFQPVPESTLKAVPSENLIWGCLKTFFSACFQLRRETQVGPWKLGPIDTTKYGRYQLDAPIANLIGEIFDIQGYQKWMVAQMIFFAGPLVHGVGGSIINR